MRAMVLAAGLGTRFRPLSDRLAKPAAPVLGEPLIRRTLRHLYSHGVRAAIVNVHHRPDDIARACEGVDGLRVRFQHERQILGTGGGVHRAAPFLWGGGGDVVVVTNGDMVFDVDLTAAIALHRERRALATMVLRRTSMVRRYGAVEIDRTGRVVRLLGLPKSRPRGRALMFTGVHLLSPAFFRALEPGPSCIVRTAYRKLVDQGAPIFGHESDARWLDIGTPADYLAANLTLLGERVIVSERANVGPGARVLRSFIDEGASIGAGASVESCVLWPGACVTPGERRVREVVT
jgi:NDP-sugar pyrophosphorylase family protein